MFDWTLLIKWIPATVGGSWRWLRRPRLELSVGIDEPWSVQSATTRPANVEPVDWVADGLMNYYRARLKNNGGRTARKCHVALTALWYVERGIWKRLSEWEPVDLIWSGRPDERTLDLSPEQTEFCDVGHVVSNYIQSNLIPATALRRIRRYLQPTGRPGRFILDVTRQYLNQPNSLEQGHYVLELSAFSLDAGGARLRVDLWVSGRFAGLTDRYNPRPLAGVVVRARRRQPDEGTLDQDTPVV